MPASMRFYRDIPGFQITSTSSLEPDCDWALLERDHIQLMLNTAYERDHRSSTPDPSGYQHKLYVLEPDGYNVCFQWPATQHVDAVSQ